MNGIVCAIRGGPDSQPTIARAIAWAKETGLPLYFLYVVNLDFLVHTSTSRVQTLTHEMAQMGEFILLTAQSKASAQGVTAEGVIRQGNVMEEITRLCHEVSVAYLVLGAPGGQEEADVFTNEAFQVFVASIEAQTGAKVIIAHREEQ